MPERSEFEVRSNEAGAFFVVRRDSMAGPHADDLDDAYWNATLSCGSLQASLRFYEIRLADSPSTSSGWPRSGAVGRVSVGGHRLRTTWNL
jgi:hypothetical protein